MDKTGRRLIVWWAVLVAATIASWETGGNALAFGVAPALVIVVLAFAKTAAVMMQFMDARTAPWPLKFGLAGWTLGVGTAVAAIWLSTASASP